MVNDTDGVNDLYKNNCIYMEELHGVLILIIKKIIGICDDNNLNYFLIEGSLLGAVRHRGIIPWDDDVDIGMPRKDYERFIKIAESTFTDNYKLVTYENGNSVIRYFSYIECSDLRIRSFAHMKYEDRNAWVDIFPLDGMPGGKFLRSWHFLKILSIRAGIQFSQFEAIVDVKKKDRPFHERLLIWFAKVFRVGNSWDTKSLMRKLDALLKMYDYEFCKYIVNAASAYKSKAIFPKEYFGTGFLYKFENLLVKGPVQSRNILKQLYGNYMVLPPETKRNIHSTLIIKE